ncbi:LOW QUALITY PROTEIN: uncharacterized protein [Bemisia tabaci]|uniref:LOW QUALITY PROTEIN: uncharacterized protein n=1 Tax=Bemisia tabaci TaxID=7038 RepID=UPI003B27F6DF
MICFTTMRCILIFLLAFFGCWNAMVFVGSSTVQNRDRGAKITRPMDTVADLTNDLGVCVLQYLSSTTRDNVAFSPYGLSTVAVLLLEGASGHSAYQLQKILRLPWDILVTKIGFRDLHRHLKSYFLSDGFLGGLIFSRNDICMLPRYKQTLLFYGFEPEGSLPDSCSRHTTTTAKTTTTTTTTTMAAPVQPSSEPSVNGTSENTTEPKENTANTTTESTTTTTTESSSNATTASAANSTTESVVIPESPPSTSTIEPSPSLETSSQPSSTTTPSPESIPPATTMAPETSPQPVPETEAPPQPAPETETSLQPAPEMETTPQPAPTPETETSPPPAQEMATSPQPTPETEDVPAAGPRISNASTSGSGNRTVPTVGPGNGFPLTTTPGNGNALPRNVNSAEPTSAAPSPDQNVQLTPAEQADVSGKILTTPEETSTNGGMLENMALSTEVITERTEQRSSDEANTATTESNQNTTEESARSASSLAPMTESTFQTQRNAEMAMPTDAPPSPPESAAVKPESSPIQEIAVTTFSSPAQSQLDIANDTAINRVSSDEQMLDQLTTTLKVCTHSPTEEATEGVTQTGTTEPNQSILDKTTIENESDRMRIDENTTTGKPTDDLNDIPVLIIISSTENDGTMKDNLDGSRTGTTDLKNHDFISTDNPSVTSRNELLPTDYNLIPDDPSLSITTAPQQNTFDVPQTPTSSIGLRVNDAVITTPEIVLSTNPSRDGTSTEYIPPRNQVELNLDRLNDIESATDNKGLTTVIPERTSDPQSSVNNNPNGNNENLQELTTPTGNNDFNDYNVISDIESTPRSRSQEEHTNTEHGQLAHSPPATSFGDIEDLRYINVITEPQLITDKPNFGGESPNAEFPKNEKTPPSPKLVENTDGPISDQKITTTPESSENFQTGNGFQLFDKIHDLTTDFPGITTPHDLETTSFHTSDDFFEHSTLPNFERDRQELKDIDKSIFTPTDMPLTTFDQLYNQNHDIPPISTGEPEINKDTLVIMEEDLDRRPPPPKAGGAKVAKMMGARFPSMNNPPRMGMRTSLVRPGEFRGPVSTAYVRTDKFKNGHPSEFHIMSKSVKVTTERTYPNEMIRHSTHFPEVNRSAVIMMKSVPNGLAEEEEYNAEHYSVDESRLSSNFTDFSQMSANSKDGESFEMESSTMESAVVESNSMESSYSHSHIRCGRKKRSPPVDRGGAQQRAVVLRSASVKETREHARRSSRSVHWHDVTPIVWNLVKHKFTSDHDLRYLQAKNRYDLSKPETSIWVSPLSSHQKIVPVMNFAAILPYAYVPAIHSHVVELPLDNPRYALMIVLPSGGKSVSHVLSHMTSRCGIRSIHSQLRLYPIHVIVPTFRIFQQLDLSPALYHFGVNAIFDPYRAHLTSLSYDPFLYVRNIEQVVTLSARKYEEQLKYNEIPIHQAHRKFYAASPFIYFVVDLETTVTLIAGVLNDPLAP